MRLNTFARRCIMLSVCAFDLALGQAIGRAWTYDEWFNSWQALAIAPPLSFAHAYLVFKIMRNVD